VFRSHPLVVAGHNSAYPRRLTAYPLFSGLFTPRRVIATPEPALSGAEIASLPATPSARSFGSQ